MTPTLWNRTSLAMPFSLPRSRPSAPAIEHGDLEQRKDRARRRLLRHMATFDERHPPAGWTSSDAARLMDALIQEPPARLPLSGPVRRSTT